MSLFKKVTCLAIPVFVSLNIFVAALSKEYTAQVLLNNEGDTLTVKIGGKKEKVRLLSVHTAEMQKGYWGQQAKKFTQSLIKGKTVKFETDVQERDQYGRMLAYVYVDNTFLNKVLLDEGMAMVLTYSPNVKYVDQFKTALKKESGEIMV